MATSAHKISMSDTMANNIETRVGRLEGAVESLASEVKQTNETVKDLAHHIMTFQDKVNSNINAASSPNWPLIVSMGSLIATIVIMGATLTAFMFSGQSERIADNRATIQHLRTTDYDAQYRHGSLDAWRENVNEELDDLDVTLQREIKLLNDFTQERIVALDNKLQHEFNGSLQVHASALENLQSWQLKHSEEAATKFGLLEGQVEAMQKKVDVIGTTKDPLYPLLNHLQEQIKSEK